MKQREIKFRAWYEKSKYMAYQGTPDLETIQSFFHYIGINEPLMQYTGLTDKNGKEVYEGDIVRVDDSVFGNPIDGYKSGIYKVEYCFPDCAFCLVQLDELSAVSFNECMEYEIIGNVYENPELLNQK